MVVGRQRSTSVRLNGSKYIPAEQQRAKDEAMYELKELLALIRYEWPQILEENANPIEMAVMLLDDTSVGLAHKAHEFEELKVHVLLVLRKVVNENYEVFNKSIGLYHQLLALIGECQEDSGEIRAMLEDTTKDMHDRSDVLNDLNNTLARYSEMIEILDAMDKLNQIPSRIDGLISDKKIHEIYDVILDAYKVADSYNLWSLLAMASVKNYLEVQLNNLFDMIIEELHNEIYLKLTSVAAAARVSSVTGSGASEAVQVAGAGAGATVGSSSVASRSVNGTETSAVSDSGGLSKNRPGRATPQWHFLVQSTSNPQLTSLTTLFTQSNNLEQYIYNSANLDIAEIADCFTDTIERFISNQLPKIHRFYTSQQGKSTDNIDYSILLESTLNSNTESLHYVYLLLFTAYKLNRLPQVLDILSNTNQQEFHSLIKSTTEETRFKNTQHMHKLLKTLHHHINNKSLQLSDDLNGSLSDSLVIVLLDLFGNVFIKSLAVLQRHKVIQEIAKRILDEESVTIGRTAQSSTPTSSRFPSAGSSINSSSYFESAWRTLQKELQSLIINYIYEDGFKKDLSGSNSSTISTSGGDIASILKKTTFKFENVSFNNSGKTTEDLKLLLLHMLPGLNLNEKGTGMLDMSPYIKTESFNTMLDVLVPSNIFNMRIILESFLIYVAGAQNLFQKQKVLPTGLGINGVSMAKSNGEGIQFFNLFMSTNFLPHLTESLNNLFEDYVSIGHEGILEGFKTELTILEDTDIKQKSSLMIYQNALDFQRLIMYICFVLNTSLMYRKGFGDLCLEYLDKFSKKYDNFYKDLLDPEPEHQTSQPYQQYPPSSGPISTSGPLVAVTSLNIKGKPSTQINRWMRTPALTEISQRILNQEGGVIDFGLIDQEIKYMLMSSTNITKDDFLDGDSFQQICHLMVTASWILTWLPGMRKELNYNVYDDDTDDVKILEVDKLKYDWSFLENGRSNATSGKIDFNHIYLTLNSAKVAQLDEIIENFTKIKNHTLIALRYDLRCKAIYYLGRSYRECNWTPVTEPRDCDQYISEYNRQVFLVDNKLNANLETNEKDKLFLGLSNFLETFIIQESKHITKMNLNGIKRILLDIFVLQQMLRNIMARPQDVDFNKSSVFFEMYTAKEHSLLELIKENKVGLTENDYKNLIRLIYSEKLIDGGNSINRTKYEDMIKKVHQLFTIQL